MPYLGLGAEISLVGYVLKTPPVGILDFSFFLSKVDGTESGYTCNMGVPHPSNMYTGSITVTPSISFAIDL